MFNWFFPGEMSDGKTDPVVRRWPVTGDLTPDFRCSLTLGACTVSTHTDWLSLFLSVSETNSDGRNLKLSLHYQYYAAYIQLRRE